MIMTPLSDTPFQGWGSISKPVSDLLTRQGRPTSIAKDTVIFGPDSPARSLLFLVCGTVRVEQRIVAGHDVVLCRAQAGEGCILTTACLLAFGGDATRSIAETHVEAVMIPRASFDEQMTISPRFRAGVFEAYSKRLTELRVAIDESLCQQKGSTFATRQFGHGEAQRFRPATYH